MKSYFSRLICFPQSFVCLLVKPFKQVVTPKCWVVYYLFNYFCYFIFWILCFDFLSRVSDACKLQLQTVCPPAIGFRAQCNWTLAEGATTMGENSSVETTWQRERKLVAISCYTAIYFKRALTDVKDRIRQRFGSTVYFIRRSGQQLTWPLASQLRNQFKWHAVVSLYFLKNDRARSFIVL